MEVKVDVQGPEYLLNWCFFLDEVNEFQQILRFEKNLMLKVKKMYRVYFKYEQD